MVKFSLASIFLPQERKFFEMLEAQAAVSVEAAVVLKEFTQEFKNLSEMQKKNYASRMKRIEHEGDRKIHEIIDQLNKAFITPIDKEDLYKLANLSDDVIDLMYATSNQITRYNIGKVDHFMEKLVEIIVEGVKENEAEIKELEKNKFAKEYFLRIHELERRADEIYCMAIEELFADGSDAVKIVKLKDIYANLELVTDKLADVAEVIEGIVIKHA